MAGGHAMGKDPLDWVGTGRAGHGDEQEYDAIERTLPSTTFAGGDAAATALALEREILLLRDVEGATGSGAVRPRGPLNRVLLLLIFAFLLVGMAIYFFERGRRSWEDRVQILKARIVAMEEDRARAERLVESLLETKDVALAAKDQELALLRKAGAQAAGLERGSLWGVLEQIAAGIQATWNPTAKAPPAAGPGKP